jgi:hypothetical protein
MLLMCRGEDPVFWIVTAFRVTAPGGCAANWIDVG